MTVRSKGEADIVHLTPPQRLQVARQVQNDMFAESKEQDVPSHRPRYRLIGSNAFGIVVTRLVGGLWFLITLIRCRRLDKNLLMALGAVALLLLQVFLLVLEANTRLA